MFLKVTQGQFSLPVAEAEPVCFMFFFSPHLAKLCTGLQPRPCRSLFSIWHLLLIARGFLFKQNHKAGRFQTQHFCPDTGSKKGATSATFYDRFIVFVKGSDRFLFYSCLWFHIVSLMNTTKCLQKIARSTGNPNSLDFNNKQVGFDFIFKNSRPTSDGGFLVIYNLERREAGSLPFSDMKP